MSHPVQSLADVGPDQVVTVGRVLFDGLQTRCAELGIRMGDRLNVGGSQYSTRVLRRADGGLVHCPPELARFVEVFCE